MSMPTGQPEADSNNFDNDFEKLDPLAPSDIHPSLDDAASGALNDFVDDLISSSTPSMHTDFAEEDMYSAPPLQPEVTSSSSAFEPEPSPEPSPELEQPLIDIGFSQQVEPPAPAEPSVPMAASSWPASDPVLPSRSPPREESPVKTMSFTAPTTTSADDEVPKEPPKPAADKGSLCCHFENMDPRVVALLYWRDLRKSAAVFGSVVILLVSLALFSVLSVASYLALLALTITLTYRVYRQVLAAVQKTGDGHPFKDCLEKEVSLPTETVHKVADMIATHAVACVSQMRRLFLVEDLVDSLKFGLLLWVMTYIGSWFNGMTLLIIGVVALFTLPKVYETYKVQIDENMELISNQVKAIWQKVQQKMPLPGKKKAE